ncbi:hypothetical protein LSM04_001854 [Trypanosoma melophagium]|uniref:uncharacterized protein n=1 Tax=Trypanosoma melophagium TaxID=715481 RepID=UPI003519F27E|nr:hypothetical protein LSM04_001854 [Trypanosoma melophagium]
MPVNFIKRLILSAVVTEGAKSPLIQRVAQKTARMERDAPEKIGVWVRATYVEAKKDVENLWAKLQGEPEVNTEKKQIDDRSNQKK